MNIEIEKMSTGYFDIFLRLSEADVDMLVRSLERLKTEPEHFFNIQSDFNCVEPGLSNLVISRAQGNMVRNADLYPTS